MKYLTENSSYLPFGKPNYGDEEIAEITRVMQSGWVGMGSETLAFEEELGRYMSSKDKKIPEVVTVNSCTSALFLSLIVEDIGPGAEVILPSLTWCSTANTVLYTGANIVFCDIDKNTFSVSTTNILEKVTDKTRAVIVVHYGGLAMDVEALRAALPDHIAIIEDAAHALGASFDEKTPVGASGNLTCFSFYANKNLATAEGGAIATFDSQKAQKLRELRLNGLKSDSWNRYTKAQSIFKSADISELGYKANYTDLQAAIGRVQLRRQTAFSKIRQEIVNFYKQSLAKIIPDIIWQSNINSPYHAKHLCVMRYPSHFPLSRDEFLVALRNRNIGASLHYPLLHHMPLYQSQTMSVNLPVSDEIGNDIITLPISASMTQQDTENVVNAIADIQKGYEYG